jgi:membrane protein
LSSVAEQRRRRPRGAAPSTPTKLRLAEWKAVVKRAFSEFMKDDCMGLAQEVAYSSLLAFFPAVAALLGLLGLLHLYDQVQSLLATVAPHGVIRFVEGLQRDSKGGTGVVALVLGLAGATWAASGAMGSVIKAVNRAYDCEETRPFWKVRLIAIELVVATAVTTIGTLLLVVFGGPLGTAVANKAHLGGAFTTLWTILRWPVAFGAILIFFALVYYLAPNREQRSWKWISPGSLLGALLWLGLSGLFAVYATFAGSYSKTYGTLASGIILLLWLNYSAWALLFGAELNAELDRQADIHAAGGPRAGLTTVPHRG